MLDEFYLSKKAPKSRDLKEKYINDKFGNTKKVLLDDNENIVDENNIIYEEEKYTDEYKNIKTKMIPKIKKETLIKMQKN